MSSHDVVHLSARAQLDYAAILMCTLQRWGVDQRDAYRQEIDQALHRLATYADLGLDRSDLRPGIRTLLVGEHFIMYRVVGHRVRVLRILHKRQDLKRTIA